VYQQTAGQVDGRRYVVRKARFLVVLRKLTGNSEVGKGSEFFFFIRVPKGTDRMPSAEQNKEMFGHNRHVLVVDECAAVLDATQAKFLRLGFQVAACLSVKDAIPFLQKREYDILLLDSKQLAPWEELKQVPRRNHRFLRLNSNVAICLIR
jgi:hypothetical protein